MSCSNVCASVAMATVPHSRPASAFLAGARRFPLLRRAAHVEQDDRRLVGDVPDLVLYVHQQAVTAGTQLARAQAAVPLQRVRARLDVSVDARPDGLVPALDQQPALAALARRELDDHAGPAASAR